MNTIEKKAGTPTAKKLVKGIYNVTLKLKIQPQIGQAEELLKNRKQEFRYLAMIIRPTKFSKFRIL